MLRAYPVLGKQKSVDICRAFVDGAPIDAEGAVFYGVNQTNQAEWVQVLKHRSPFYYLDNAYFDATRGTHFRATRNALQHTGIGTSTGRRLSRIPIDLQPWIDDAQRSDTALVLEQSPDFVKILHGRFPDDVVRLLLAVARQAGLRPHLRSWDPNKQKQAASFAYQLQETRRVITFSSAGAITAAIAGVPFFTLDHTCAAAVFSTPASLLGTAPVTPSDEARTRWLSVLADQQWTLDEIRQGAAWQTINRPQEVTL